MTYSPGLKAKQNLNISASSIQITNNLNVSGNSILGNATSDTISIAGRLYMSYSLTCSANITSSYASTAADAMEVDGNTITNRLTSSVLETTIFAGATTTVTKGLAVNGNIVCENLLFTSSNTSTNNNAVTNLFSYPTNFEKNYLVESDIIAKSENKIRITGSTTVANSEFGAAIVAKDNEVFIGARKAPDTSQRRGRVYVYSTDSNGNIKSEVAVLSSSGNPSAQWFGDKLLIHKNQLIVGAPNNSTDGSSVTGSVYVFESGTNGWIQVQKLTPADGVAKNEFGGALHGSGNYLFIGSPQDKISSGVTGSVYVFVTGTGGWTEIQKLSSSFGTTSSFAQSITTIGEDLLIGIGSNTVSQGTGSLVLFQSGAIGWEQKEKISFAENIYDTEQLLTLEDKKTVIMSDVATGTNTGKVFIILSGSSGYSTIQTITASDQQINARFGASLQASGTTLYIANESFGSTRHGVYVFNSGTNGWTQTTKITPSNVTNIKDSAAGARDAYGTSLCLHKNTIYDGGPQDDQYASDKGAVIYFLSGNSGWQQQGIPLSFINSIRGIYKNIGGTLYLTGTSTLYSSSDFQQSSTLTTSYIDISPLNLTSVLSPGHQSYAMSSLYDQSTQKYYIATGQQNASSNAGVVRIFSSSDSVTWSSAIATYNGGTSSNLGTQIKLLSSSYGLYCIVSAYSESSANDVGSVHYASSSNGADWSSLIQIETGSTTSRFGNTIDAIYDSINNKFILLVGALYEATQTGYVYCITSSNGVNWTSKQRILEGNSTLDNVGDGVAIISCSSGYQAYAAGRQEDIPSSSIGNIFVVTSSDALTWSTKIVIASGSYTNSATTNLGVGGIKAINYNNKSYVFFPETIYDTGSVSTSNEGAVFVISSSDNNSWGNVDIYSAKTMIASGSTPSDTIPENSTVTKTLDVNIFGNKIYYAFGAPIANTANVDAGKVYLGSSSDGLTWQKYIAGQQDMTVFTGSVTNNFFGRSTSILSSANYLNLYTNNTSAIFYTNVAYVTQSGVPGVNLADVSFGISSSNITINVTGSTGINISWNHLTKIYEV